MLRQLGRPVPALIAVAIVIAALLYAYPPSGRTALIIVVAFFASNALVKLMRKRRPRAQGHVYLLYLGAIVASTLLADVLMRAVLGALPDMGTVPGALAVGVLVAALVYVDVRMKVFS